MILNNLQGYSKYNIHKNLLPNRVDKIRIKKKF